jgi:hypothetical protein
MLDEAAVIWYRAEGFAAPAGDLLPRAGVPSRAPLLVLEETEKAVEKMVRGLL